MKLSQDEIAEIKKRAERIKKYTVDPVMRPLDDRNQLPFDIEKLLDHIDQTSSLPFPPWEADDLITPDIDAAEVLLEEENRHLRDILGYYASPKMYEAYMEQNYKDSGQAVRVLPIEEDCGQKAREILELYQQ